MVRCVIIILSDIRVISRHCISTVCGAPSIRVANRILRNGNDTAAVMEPSDTILEMATTIIKI